MRVFHARDVDEAEYAKVTSSRAASASKPADRVLPQQETLPWTCLLLSFYKQRMQAMSEAATKSGWRPLKANSVGEALRLQERWQTQLAIIDLGTMPEKQKETFRKFAVKYTAETNSLLIVCEEESSPAGELWARKIGSWLYLPDADLKEGLNDLYKEAIGVANKMGLRPILPTSIQ